MPSALPVAPAVPARVVTVALAAAGLPLAVAAGVPPTVAALPPQAVKVRARTPSAMPPTTKMMVLLIVPPLPGDEEAGLSGPGEPARATASLHDRALLGREPA